MNRAFILILCLACLTVYFNSLNNDFVLDDELLIIKNPVIKSRNPLPLIFKRGLYEYPGIEIEIPFDKMYRPLQSLTYSIEYKIWKLNPFGFHLTNVLIHLFNSIIVYYLLLNISNNTVARISSALFLVHPIHISVVSYIAGRADLLVSLFMFLSLIGFVKFLKVKLSIYYIFSLLFAVCALFSRENALLLFLFIALILYSRGEKLKNYILVIPFIFLDLAYICLRFFVLGHDALAIHPIYLSIPLRIINLANIIPRYLFILLLPKELHLLRTTPFVGDLFEPKALFAIASILFYILMIIRYRQKNRLLVFSMLWFLIGMIAVFIYLDGYILLNEAIMAESWVYIPSIGFFIIFAFLLSRLKNLGRIILVCFIGFYSLLVVINNTYWKNKIILYKNILEYTPRDPVRLDLIDLYLRYGRYEDARDEIEKFAVYYPDTSKFYSLWGDYYFSTGQLHKAIDSYNKSLNKNKRSFRVCYNIGVCYLKLKQLDRAKDYFLKCLEIKPQDLSSLIRLGDLYLKTRNYSEAKKYYQMALELEPYSQFIKDRIKDAE